MVAACLRDPPVPTPGTIAVTALEQKLDEIRESLKRDALPLTMDSVEIEASELDKFDDLCFVRQLRGIGLGSGRLELAKLDYYRAFAQRSQWVRNSLVLDDEVSRFETTLVEEWQPRFEQMRDALDENCGDAELRKAGLGLYSWVENEARFPFRTLTNRFLNVGSYHILADKLRVGWHRDYAKLFAKLLEDA